MRTSNLSNHHASRDNELMSQPEVSIQICGYTIVVDAEDTERILRQRWSATIAYGVPVFRCKLREGGKLTCLTLARFICGLRDDLLATQTSASNYLDYRKESLRCVDMAERQAMQGKRTSRKYTSQYKGVSLCPRSKLWRASIRPKGISMYLGVYKTEEEAAAVYDRAARLYFGDEAFQNFPFAQHTAKIKKNT